MTFSENSINEKGIRYFGGKKSLRIALKIKK